MNVAKPRHPRTHPDRFNECQIAVEERVLSIFGDATTAGWDKDEVLAAVIEDAENPTLAMHTNEWLSVKLNNLIKKKDI